MRLDKLHEQAITPPRYRTPNWSSFTVTLGRRGSVLIWLDKDMTWLAPHDGRPGRPAAFLDAAIQFCLTIKVLFKAPCRQPTEIVASLLKLANLDWTVPDCTTLCRWQQTLAVQIPYRRADGSLNLLVDSAGIKVRRDGEWQARNHACSGSTPVAQGASGHGYDHFGHPGGGSHPRQRRSLSRFACKPLPGNGWGL